MFIGNSSHRAGVAVFNRISVQNSGAIEVVKMPCKILIWQKIDSHSEFSFMLQTRSGLPNSCRFLQISYQLLRLFLIAAHEIRWGCRMFVVNDAPAANLE